jgi:hypothetical protein
MSNKRGIFREQQRDAFYAHHFDTMPLKEFEAYMDKYRPTVPAIFPTPECIYRKKLSFLPEPLIIMQQRLGLGLGLGINTNESTTVVQSSPKPFSSGSAQEQPNTSSTHRINVHSRDAETAADSNEARRPAGGTWVVRRLQWVHRHS